MQHQGEISLTPYRELRTYTGAFKRYLQRYDVAHALTYVMPHPAGAPTEIVSLWRAMPRQQPGMREQRTLGTLMPHVMRARSINRRLIASRGRHAESLTLLVNRHGVIQTIGESARALLALEWPTWSGPFLPTPLWHVLCQSCNGHYGGRFLRIDAAVQDDLLVVHIERMTAGQALLTPAELRLGRLIAEGATYKDAARLLGVSPATVRNQLHSVYGKLGIAGRRQLSAALAP